MAFIHRTVVSSLVLWTTLATALQYQNTTAISDSPITRTADGQYFTSSLGQPKLFGFSYTWSQYIIPTTVGTVMVTVNEATNKTMSTTIFHSEYKTNGSMQILGRTDINDAGTVTKVTTDMHNNSITLTYPTNYIEVAPELTWSAVIPTSNINGTCCYTGTIHSPIPTEPPIQPPSTTNPTDPEGWLFTLKAGEGGLFQDPDVVFEAMEVSSMWAGQTIDVSYEGCGYKDCGFPPGSTVAGASAVKSQAFLLATERTTISSGSGGQKTEEPTPKPTKENSPTPTPKPTKEDVPTPTEEPIPIPTGNDQADSDEASPTDTSDGDGIGDPIVSIINNLPDATPATENEQPSESESPIVSGAAAVTAQNDLSPLAEGTQEAATPRPVTALPAEQPSKDGVAIPSPIAATGVLANGPSNVVISGQTLALDSPITLGTGPSATVIAIHTSDGHTVVHVGSSVMTYQPDASDVPQQAGDSPQPIVVGAQTITAAAPLEYIAEDGQTLSPGSTIIIGSGKFVTTIALETDSPQPVLIVDGSRTTLPPSTAASLPPLTFGSAVLTPNIASEYIVAGQTLRPGDAIVVEGTTVSLASGVTELVVGDETIKMTAEQAETTAGEDMAGYILSAIGGTQTATRSGGAVETTEGESGRPQNTGSTVVTSPEEATTISMSGASSELAMRWTGICLFIGITLVVAGS